MIIVEFCVNFSIHDLGDTNVDLSKNQLSQTKTQDIHLSIFYPTIILILTKVTSRSNLQYFGFPFFYGILKVITSITLLIKDTNTKMAPKPTRIISGYCSKQYLFTWIRTLVCILGRLLRSPL